ncbi:MAG: ATP synthase subunit C [Spirochaetaceae bacterium]|jgi:V/A-type H+-transporting ATPase subunit K|nr:ATP synthase subunit C [Spirochaetaceae bacterium]
MKRFITAVTVFITPAALFAEEAGASASSGGIKYIAAALAVGIACIGGGIAVGHIGAAAMGAMSENAELSGKAMPFVGLAEGICLWGFLVGLLILIL